MTKSRGIRNPPRRWSNEEDAIIAEHYPHTPTGELLDLFKCKADIFYKHVEKLGIKKSEVYTSEYGFGKLKSPVGTERVICTGEVLVKTLPGQGRCERTDWAFKRRVVWEKANGPIPDGHMIMHRDGNRLNCELENLECIRRGDFLKKHGLSSLPPELVEIINLKGTITRAINRRLKNER